MVDHFVMKLRMVRFWTKITTHYSQVMSGNLSMCGLAWMAHHITKTAFRVLKTLETWGAPEPNIPLLWIESLTRNTAYTTEVSIKVNHSAENDDLMRNRRRAIIMGLLVVFLHNQLQIVQYFCSC